MDLTDEQWDDPNLTGLARMYRDTFHDGPCRYDDDGECIGCSRVKHQVVKPSRCPETKQDAAGMAIPRVAYTAAYDGKRKGFIVVKTTTEIVAAHRNRGVSRQADRGVRSRSRTAAGREGT